MDSKLFEEYKTFYFDQFERFKKEILEDDNNDDLRKIEDKIIRLCNSPVFTTDDYYGENGKYLIDFLSDVFISKKEIEAKDIFPIFPIRYNNLSVGNQEDYELYEKIIKLLILRNSLIH